MLTVRLACWPLSWRFRMPARCRRLLRHRARAGYPKAEGVGDALIGLIGLPADAAGVDLGADAARLAGMRRRCQRRPSAARPPADNPHRLRQVSELFGDALTGPDARFRLLLALLVRRLLGAPSGSLRVGYDPFSKGEL